MIADIFNTVASAGGLMTMVAGAGVALVGLKSAIYLNGEKQDKLITRWGKQGNYLRTANTPGLKFKVPFLEYVSATVSTELRTEKLEDLQFRGSDKQFFQLPVVIQYRVSDSRKFHFDVDNPISQMREVVTNTVRSYCAGKDYDQLLNEKDEADQAIKHDVEGAVAELGITLHKVMVNDPDVDEEVKRAYNNVVAEQLKKEAAVTRANADLEVREINGKAASKFRTESAKGYPELIRMFRDADVSEEGAMRFVERMAVLDKYERMAESGNAILLPAPAIGGGSADNLQEIITALKTVDAQKKGTPANDSAPAMTAAPQAEQQAAPAPVPKAPGA